MKQEQIERLKSSFKMIEPLSETVADRFYGNLFRLAPELKKRFENVDMATQGSMILEVVGIAIKGLQSLEELLPFLASLGYQHTTYGVKQQNYAVAVEALLIALRETLGKQFDPELEDIWQQMLIKITTVMGEDRSSITDQKGSKASQIRGNKKLVDPNPDDYLARFLPEGEYVEPETIPNPEPVIEGMPQTVTVDFIGDKKVESAPMKTILDISLGAGIAHVCECESQGKCTTCRVVVLEGLGNCLPRNKIEARVAKIKGLPPELRMACQTRVAGPVKVRRLVHDLVDINEVMSNHRNSEGREIPLAVLFSDIRGFTKFAEGNLPYDIVHALNRYFNAVGQAIDENEGFIDKYMGDGIMALFGLNPNRAEQSCADAVNAAVGMLRSLREVNEYMSVYLEHEFRIGIGIDFGTVVVGKIGFNARKQFTAIGDTVNIASRLESETKNHEADILVSDSVRNRLPNGVFSFGQSVEVSLKGKSGLYSAHEVLTPVYS